MSGPRRRRAGGAGPRRCRGEGGLALIEAGIVTPILLTLIFGIIEYGMFFRDSLALSDATGTAAQTGAMMGNEILVSGRTADYEIARSVRENLASVPPEWIKKIVVFKGHPAGAGSAMDQIPAACRTATASVSGQCNVYDPQATLYNLQIDNPSFFSCTNSSSPAQGWCPEDRRDGSEGNGTVDYVGVWLQIERPQLTRIFGGTVTIDRAAVARLEPDLGA